MKHRAVPIELGERVPCVRCGGTGVEYDPQKNPCQARARPHWYSRNKRDGDPCKRFARWTWLGKKYCRIHATMAEKGIL